MEGVKEKRCNTCNVIKPITPEFWHKRNISPDGFHNTCKICRNEKKRIARAKKKGTKIEMEPVNPDGLNTNINVINGQRYEVFTPNGREDGENETFVGVLIQETENHITLKNDIGYCESFTKVNISLKVHQIKEVKNV